MTQTNKNTVDKLKLLFQINKIKVLRGSQYAMRSTLRWNNFGQQKCFEGDASGD